MGHIEKKIFLFTLKLERLKPVKKLQISKGALPKKLNPNLIKINVEVKTKECS